MATFQVPQFIDTEDKIVGPLTLKQFFYFAAAFGISLGLFYLLNFWLWLVIAVFFWASAAGLAFLKISGRSLPLVIVSALEFYWNPRVIMWRHEIFAPADLEDKVSKIKIPSFERRAAPLPQAKIPAPKIIITKKPELEASPITTGSSLKDLSEKMMTTKNVITDRERDFSFFRRRKKDQYSIIEKFTGERVAAKRVDYR
ncbi:MAG: PrgI family protein [Candidatus Paceibacterota bacterium]